ncbi:MAG: C39 family peptidase [Candidatus Liptonbacteria bacterium]|nr:C39 family peptidase [Candidatus Liptonbacteria bacterium]
MPYVNFLLGLMISAPIAVSGAPISAIVNATSGAIVATATSSLGFYNGAPTTVPSVPFYSQLRDINAVRWQKIGCGVASLAMIIEYYKPGEIVSVDQLLKEGIAAGAYLKGAGWTHRGLTLLAKPYGLGGANYDLSGLKMAGAFAEFLEFLKEGPVIASVYYKFDPKSPIPHLVVINGIEDGYIYYNDPAGVSAGEKISVADFMRGWKKKFIVVEPV